MKTQKKTPNPCGKSCAGAQVFKRPADGLLHLPCARPALPTPLAARSLLYAGRCSCQPARLPIPARSRTRNGQEEVACCPPGGPVALPAGHVGSGAPQGEPQDHRGSPR